MSDPRPPPLPAGVKALVRTAWADFIRAETERDEEIREAALEQLELVRRLLEEAAVRSAARRAS